MRHRNKVKKLGRPQDQRKAMIRSMATSLFMHGQIQTTMPRAKVLKSYAEKLISFAKKGDLHSRRQVAAHIYDQQAGETTVLQKLFSEIGPKYRDRNGGYTKVYRTGYRRGDNAEMALIQLT